MSSRQIIACLLLRAATGLVAPTKQALHVAKDGAEDRRVDAAAALPVHAASTTTRPPTTASLYSGSVAAKATPALPNAEAPPPVRALVTFAGVVAGAAAIGFDVELAAVAAGAAAVFSALDYYSPVGQLERSVGRLDRLSSDGAKASDGVTDAVQGNALEIAVDAIEASPPHAPVAAAAPSAHAPPAASGAPPAPAAARKSRKLYSVGEEMPMPGREQDFEAHQAQERQWAEYEAAQQRQAAQYQAAQERQYAQSLSAAMTTEVLYQKLEQARLDLMGSTTVETATPLVALIKDITAAIANVERLY